MNAQIDFQTGMKYIQIVCKNNTGILNRVSSLMRRRNFNMEEVSVSFDSEWRAHMLIAIVAVDSDVKQIISQLEKLHDVYEAYNAESEMENIYFAFYVYGKEQDLEIGRFSPVNIVKKNGGYTKVFMVDSFDLEEFKTLIDGTEYYYKERIMNLI